MAKAQDDDWRLINKPQGEGRFHPTGEGRINDSSPGDSGNNMGRIARTGVWDVEIARLMREERISSIPIAAWQAFLGSFHESTTWTTHCCRSRAVARRFGTDSPAAPTSSLQKLPEVYPTRRS